MNNDKIKCVLINECSVKNHRQNANNYNKSLLTEKHKIIIFIILSLKYQ